jgi:hypothetical protein
MASGGPEIFPGAVAYTEHSPSYMAGKSWEKDNGPMLEYDSSNTFNSTKWLRFLRVGKRPFQLLAIADGDGQAPSHDALKDLTALLTHNTP